MTNKKNKYNNKKNTPDTQSSSKIIISQEELTTQCLQLHELLKDRTTRLRAMKDGELCYLLSTKWLEEWKEYVGYELLLGDGDQKKGKKDKKYGKRDPGKINLDIIANGGETREFYEIPKQMEEYSYLNQLVGEKKEKDDDFIAITAQIWFAFLAYYEGHQIRRPIKISKGSVFYDGEPLKCDVIFVNINEEGLQQKIKKTNKKNYNSLFPSEKMMFSTLWTIIQLKEFLSLYCEVVYNNSKIKLWKCYSYVATNPIVQSLVESIKLKKYLVKGRELTCQRYTGKEIDYYLKSTHTLIVEMGEVLKEEIQEDELKGYCQECIQKKTLTVSCVCGEVVYCSRKCRTNDQNFHFHTCESAFDSQDDEEYSKNSLEGVPISGLDNIGNTCYMNSTIQALLSLNHLRLFFSSNKFLPHMNEKEFKENRCMFLRKFSKTIKALIQTKDSYTPWPLKSQIDYSLSPFRGDKQHDANDFLVNFLNVLNDHLSKSEEKAYHAILEPFVGQFYSKVLCPHCQSVSQNNQIFMQVSLPIKAKVQQKIYQYNVFESLIRVRKGKSSLSESWEQMKKDLQVGKGFFCLAKEPMGLTLVDEQQETPEKVIKNLKGDIIFFKGQEILEDETAFVFGLVTSKNIMGNKLKSPYGTPIFISFNDHLQTLATLWLLVIKRYFDNNKQIVQEAEAIERQYNQEIEFQAKESKKIQVKQSTEGQKQQQYGEQQKLDDIRRKIIENYTNRLEQFAFKIGIEIYIYHFKRNRNTCKFCNKKCSNCDLPKAFNQPFSQFFKDRYDEVRFQVHLRENLTIQNINQDKCIIGDPTIQDCLELFAEPEQLDEENAWYCYKCDSMALALKELHIKTFPSILIIHLNRFKTLDNKKIKNNDPIQYGEIQNLGGKQYRLISVIIHEGSMDAGHYWCISLRGAQYYIFNDAKVSKTDRVFHKNAYILFYQLIQP